ncbi:MAG: transposase [Lachnospiraceae bacterium]|nr:transposase [Lachnospiraceae bacterium]
MARIPRAKSANGYYHVMSQGNGKQILFEDDKDRIRFLNLLKKYCPLMSVTICAYCLMDNHVHLLLKDNEGKLSEFMHRIGLSYAKYYNKKYDHCGHVFRGPFKSIPVNTERAFRAVYRYILRNPEKANICRASRYPWSSYKLHGKRSSFMDTSMAMHLIGSRTSFEQFIAQDPDEEYDEFLDHKKPGRDDAWALRVMRRCLSVISGSEIRRMGREERKHAILTLKKWGLSERMISRLTGINRTVVRLA